LINVTLHDLKGKGVFGYREFELKPFGDKNALTIKTINRYKIEKNEVSEKIMDMRYLFINEYVLWWRWWNNREGCAVLMF
jgi:hypothetical protein